MKVATREAYGDVLVELGRENPSIVVLDADLSGSTKTAKFARAFPDRFFNVGIAEADMMGIAAGLAQSGKIPFVSTFAVFATGRTYDQIRQSIAYPRFGVKIVATHGGLTVGPDGASHQALEDIALMRVLPNMTVIVPCDATQTRQAVRAAASHNGPVYIRLGREAVSSVTPEGVDFEIGKGSVLWPSGQSESARLDRNRSDFDVALIGCGIMVEACLQAARSLEDNGVSCVVADFASVKPLDEELLLAIARRSRVIVTAEEHSVIGGLGGAVCEYLAGVHPVPVCRLGVNDSFGESGSASDLLKLHNLTSEGLIALATKALQQKG